MTSLNGLRAKFPQYKDVSDGDFLYAIRNKFYPDMHPRAFFNQVDGAANAHVTIKQFRDDWRSEVKKPMGGESKEQASARLSGTSTGPVGDPGSKAMKAARSGFQGLTFGAGDEVTAAATSLLSGTDYDAELKRERDRLAIGREQNPVMSTAAELAGAIAVPGAAIKGAKAAPIKTAGISAAAGATGAGIYGFNSGEGDERLANARDTAILGGIIGAAAPSVGGLVERGLNSRAAKKASAQAAKMAKPLDDLRAEASKIFQKADTTGIPAAGLPAAVQNIGNQISKRPINPKITPRTAGSMDDLTDLATEPRGTVAFGELRDIHRGAGAARADFSNPTDQRGGAIIQKGINEFVESVDPALGDDVAKATKMWARLRKSEQIDEVIEKAQKQASGFENGLRIGFRQILNNKKKRAGFSKAEIAAMEQIVEGTTFGNVMKKLGKFSFGSGAQTNVLSGTAGAGLGGAAGTALLGPAGVALAAIPPIIGYGAKRASEKTTENLATGLRGMVAAGKAPTVPTVTTQGRGLLDLAARRVGRGQVPLDLQELMTLQQTQGAQ